MPMRVPAKANSKGPTKDCRDRMECRGSCFCNDALPTFRSARGFVLIWRRFFLGAHYSGEFDCCPAENMTNTVTCIGICWQFLLARYASAGDDAGPLMTVSSLIEARTQ